MRYILTALILVCAFVAQAQQVNPVPDYVFSNRMSVGRNAVTDTAAYFSIGPRYGANKGFMPPIVGDTAHVNASNKRNGLLIFSVQKNKFLYWDSVRVQWSDMAGSSGSYIVAGDTAAMLSPYVRHAGYGLTKSSQSFLVDTAAIATRARVQKGIDSVAGLSRITGSGTTNYVPKFTGSTVLGNSVIYDDGSNIGIGTTSNLGYWPANLTQSTAKSAIYYSDATTNLDNANPGLVIFNSDNTASNSAKLLFGAYNTDPTPIGLAYISALKGILSTGYVPGILVFGTSPGGSSGPTERMRITNAGEVLVGTTTDAGAYALQVAGSIYNTTGAVFAASSGIVGVGTTATPSASTIRFITKGSGVQDSYIQIENGSGGGAIIGSNNGSGLQIYGFTGSTGSESYTKRMEINSTGETLLGGGTDAGAYALQVAGSIYNTTGAVLAASSGNVGVGTAAPINKFSVFTGGDETANFTDLSGYASLVYRHRTTNAYRDGLIDAANLYINSESAGEVRIGTKTDAGAYALQVAGSIYNTTGAVLAASSGSVGIGTSSITGKMQIQGAQQDAAQTIVRMAANNSSAQIKAVDFQINAGSNLFVFNTAYAGTGLGFDFADAGTSLMRITSSSEVLIGTTSDAGAFALQVQGDVLFSGGVKTAQPTGGTAGRWRLGEAATVSPTSPNRTIRVEIEGTVYYIHAKTTND